MAEDGSSNRVDQKAEKAARGARALARHGTLRALQGFWCMAARERALRSEEDVSAYLGEDRR